MSLLLNKFEETIVEIADRIFNLFLDLILLTVAAYFIKKSLNP